VEIYLIGTSFFATNWQVLMKEKMGFH